MKIKSLAANRTELHLPDVGYTVNRVILFSYETPVAYAETNETGRHYYKTDCRWSKTTTRHIKSWLPEGQAVEQPQTFFDDLAK